MQHWIIFAVAIFCTACIPQNTATPAIAVDMTVEPFIEPTSTPDCLHADGVTIEVTRMSNTKVSLRVSGLQPGEIPYVTFYTSTRHNSLGFTSGKFAEGADLQGDFFFEQGGLFPPEGETSATWDIRFIHARGVECATVTLP